MNSIDGIIEKTFTTEEIQRAGDMLLHVSSKFFAEAMANPFEWAQSMALMLQCELNRVTK